MTGAALAQAGRLALAGAVLWLVLIQPNHPAAMTWGALGMFPLELPAILLVLAALPAGARATGAVRALLVASITVIALAKLADYATFTAFNRAFNLLVDAHLVAAAWNLGSGAIGVPLALAALAGAVLALAAAVAALWWATGQWAGLMPVPAWRGAAAVLALPAAGLAVGEIGHAMRAWEMPARPPGAAFTARVGVERVLFYRAALADLDEFRRVAAADPFAAADPAQLLDRIGETDVLIVFVESYGRSSFDNPLYAPTHTATLADIEDRLAARGLAMRSAFLTAPMVGGQSWLAHASVASGLWIDGQRRHQTLLASPRRTLYHFAQAAGFRTAAVMPAITMAWPEGDFFGFDAIHPAAALGYLGDPFNWVTMPDQFTLAALDRLERPGRPGADRPPLFAQVALISSHAPWVPIPPLIDWAEVGDGTVFNRWANSGDPPEVVWRDHDRVRDQFRLAVDYSLQVVGSYAERHAGAPPLMLILGDHEPAPFVSGVAGFDVPVHLIGPPELVALAEDWGWQPGLRPDADAPVWRMDRMRDRFLAAFSSAAPLPEGHAAGAAPLPDGALR